MHNEQRQIGSAEFQLIRIALREDADSDAALCVALQQPLDWPQLHKLALAHGVLPLIHRRLQQVAAGLAPAPAMRMMAIWQKAHELCVAQMTGDLIKVVRTLEAAQIHVICIKGPVLAQFAYGDPAMRDFDDLDILVKQSDYAQAESILHRLGLQPTIDEFFPTHTTTEHELSSERERHFTFPNQPYCIELHWRLTTSGYPRALDTAPLWLYSQQVLLQGHTLCTLGLADQRLHTCHHGTHHFWAKLRYLVDFSASMRAIDAEGWQALLDNAHRQGLFRPLLVALGLSRDLLGHTLPAHITRLVQRDLLARWSIRYIKSLMMRVTNSGLDDFDPPLLHFLLADKQRCSGFATMTSRMFKPTHMDYQWISLPRSLHWLYPVLRPIRRIWRGLAMLSSRNHHSSINDHE